MLLPDDLPITCSVELVDGIPQVTAVVEGLPVFLERNGIEMMLPPLTQPFPDLGATPGERADYWAWAGFGRDGAGVDCGGVDVPADRPVRGAILAARQLGATFPMGPHVYWDYRLVCDGCDVESTLVYFIRTEDPPDPGPLPEGHPGLLSPVSVHDFLLDQLDEGNEVAATFGEFGQVLNWTVDGFGVETVCLLLDTQPPEMNPGHCGYEQ